MPFCEGHISKGGSQCRQRFPSVANEANGFIIAPDLSRIDINVHDGRPSGDLAPVVSAVLICPRTNQKDQVGTFKQGGGVASE